MEVKDRIKLALILEHVEKQKGHASKLGLVIGKLNKKGVKDHGEIGKAFVRRS